MSVRNGTLDDGFGYWLAGLIDGEGCFGIYASNRNKGHDDYRLTFSLTLRDDDEPMLQEIHRRLEFGGFTRERRQRAASRAWQWKSNPTVTWGVWNRAGHLALVEVLDRYPLRSKKARDYAIWREALLTARCDWQRLAELQQLLRTTRAYEPAEIPAPPEPPLALFTREVGA